MLKHLLTWHTFPLIHLSLGLGIAPIFTIQKANVQSIPFVSIALSTQLIKWFLKCKTSEISVEGISFLWKKKGKAYVPICTDDMAQLVKPMDLSHTT